MESIFLSAYENFIRMFPYGIMFAISQGMDRSSSLPTNYINPLHSSVRGMISSPQDPKFKSMLSHHEVKSSIEYGIDYDTVFRRFPNAQILVPKKIKLLLNLYAMIFCIT